jgi:hypothetical protein
MASERESRPRGPPVRSGWLAVAKKQFSLLPGVGRGQRQCFFTLFPSGELVWAREAGGAAEDSVALDVRSVITLHGAHSLLLETADTKQPGRRRTIVLEAPAGALAGWLRDLSSVVTAPSRARASSAHQREPPAPPPHACSQRHMRELVNCAGSQARWTNRPSRTARPRASQRLPPPRRRRCRLRRSRPNHRPPSRSRSHPRGQKVPRRCALACRVRPVPTRGRARSASGADAGPRPRGASRAPHGRARSAGSGQVRVTRAGCPNVCTQGRDRHRAARRGRRRGRGPGHAAAAAPAGRGPGAARRGARGGPHSRAGAVRRTHAHRVDAAESDWPLSCLSRSPISERLLWAHLKHASLQPPNAPPRALAAGALSTAAIRSVGEVQRSGCVLTRAGASAVSAAQLGVLSEQIALFVDPAPLPPTGPGSGADSAKTADQRWAAMRLQVLEEMLESEVRAGRAVRRCRARRVISLLGQASYEASLSTIREVIQPAMSSVLQRQALPPCRLLN